MLGPAAADDVDADADADVADEDWRLWKSRIRGLVSFFVSGSFAASFATGDLGVVAMGDLGTAATGERGRGATEKPPPPNREAPMCSCAVL